MKEFSIFFRYGNQDQKAHALQNCYGAKTEFHIRPVSPEIVRKFGQQITIYRIGWRYKILRQVKTADKPFYSALISAIHSMEYGDLEQSVKILIEKRPIAPSKKPLNIIQNVQKEMVRRSHQ